MKKEMMVMTLVVVIFFIVLMIAVSPSFAENANQTAPKPPWLPTPEIIEKAKDKFWDLEVAIIVINGQYFPPPNTIDQAKVINVKVGQKVGCLLGYKIKTIPIGNITQADVLRWGSGKSYKIEGGLCFPGPPSHQDYKTETQQTPKFTYADVQAWKNKYGENGIKEWYPSLIYFWKAGPEHVGKTIYLHFSVDSFYDIKETNEDNNGLHGSGIVAKFIVTPVSPAALPADKLKKNSK